MDTLFVDVVLQHDVLLVSWLIVFSGLMFRAGVLCPSSLVSLLQSDSFGNGTAGHTAKHLRVAGGTPFIIKQNQNLPSYSQASPKPSLQTQPSQLPWACGRTAA